MRSTIEQAQAFVGWALGHVQGVEFAAAKYNSAGKVVNIEHGRLSVSQMSDFARVLPWLRAQNAAAGRNIWVRPSDSEHPLLMLDDVKTPLAMSIARKYESGIVETREGNCHVWLVSTLPLIREERQKVLRHLIAMTDADVGALSEPRWGRLPGFQGRKPRDVGVWTNLLHLPPTQDEHRLFDPMPYLSSSHTIAGTAVGSLPPSRGGASTFIHCPGDIERRWRRG